MPKQNVSATIDDVLAKRLDSMARETERNRSWLISRALECYFEELEDVRIAKERLQEQRLTPVQLRKAIGL